MMTMQKSQRKTWGIRVAAIAAVLAMVFSGAGVYRFYDVNYQVDSTVSLDVNPSVMIKLNQKERVLQAVPLNQDGKTIIGDMDFQGSSLELTVNALVGSMLRNGYLTELANSVLISVDGRNEEKASALQRELSAEIDNMLRSSGIEPSVVSQVIEKDDSEQLAEACGISMGKAQFIEKLCADDLRYQGKEKELAGMTVNELNLIVQSNGASAVDSIGKASTEAYITKDVAIQNALEHALKHSNLKKTDVTDLTAELEAEDGLMVYEIEVGFQNKNLEYEYHIDAVSGKIIKSEWEKDEEREDEDIDLDLSHAISKEAAEQAALQHAGIRKADARKLKIELDDEGSKPVYEVEFKSKDLEYEYHIDAISGKIIDFEWEKEDDDVPETSFTISKEAAGQAALQHAGIRKADARKLKIELDDEGGKPVYEVEFKSKDLEYEYHIDAVSGVVLKYEYEEDD